ncbi:MAG TPA: 3'-5' exonuclease [Polyangiaceae bacterium]|nr:3'-5' exonuclease [Polyangiaceae bacterium]
MKIGEGPPPGPPWDLPVPEAPLAFVDLEMTGLDPTIDHVVEVCVERWRGDKKEDALESLVRPPSRAGGNAHVHGIDEAAVAAAPTFDQIADEILRILNGAIFVAHAAEYDAMFLIAEMNRVGRVLTIEHFIDTLILSRRSFALTSHSLSSVSAHLGITRVRAHRAGDDVRALRGVFDGCVKVLSPVSARDLWEVRIAERRARAAILSACEAAAEHKAPVDIVYRPTRKGAQKITMVVTEVQAVLDPPRVLGYLLPGRGRRELRADRILRVEPTTEKS